MKSDKLNHDVEIYKYLSIESFLCLLHYRHLMFSKITTWTDAFEGYRFDFFKKIQNSENYSNKTKDNIFASSWTLQKENSCCYKDRSEHVKAEIELKKNGSASMWDGYCKNGGVRIKTTIGKVLDILNQYSNSYQIFNNVVDYKPLDYVSKDIAKSPLISKLFMKSVSFRHESEYRFILMPNKVIKDDHIFFPLSKLYDFVDEFLISPSTKQNEWIAKMLYGYAVSITCPSEICGTNRKNNQQYCRISNLFGNISEQI